MIYVKEDKNPKRRMRIPKVVTVINPKVNIRSEPDKSKDNIVKVVFAGAKFSEVQDASTDEFVAINIEGTTCYVMRTLVEISDNQAYVANQFERALR